MNSELRVDLRSPQKQIAHHYNITFRLTGDDFVLGHERTSTMIAQVNAFDHVQRHMPRPLSSEGCLAGSH